MRSSAALPILGPAPEGFALRLASTPEEPPLGGAPEPPPLPSVKLDWACFRVYICYFGLIFIII
jgi:hypothetical protein